MDFLIPPKHQSHLRKFPWIFIFGICCILSLLLLIAGDSFQNSDSSLAFCYKLSRYFLVLTCFLGFFVLLLLLNETITGLRHQSEQLEHSLESLDRQRNLLSQISQASRLCDTSKEIVFRDTEQIDLGEAVLGKLHQHDFDAAQLMVESMASKSRYSALAQRLQKMVDKYRTATEDGRISQVVHHIEALFDQHLWAQAASQIDNLAKMFPHSEKAGIMTDRLQEKKNLHKGKLLIEWDQAVQNKDTDRGLEILKELDTYLTPSEALALQESASSVFKSKLHNLGVQFSMAVAEGNWPQALESARSIVQNFPNSRMAAEIRSKMDIIQERARSGAEPEASSA